MYFLSPTTPSSLPKTNLITNGHKIVNLASNWAAAREDARPGVALDLDLASRTLLG